MLIRGKMYWEKIYNESNNVDKYIILQEHSEGWGRAAWVDNIPYTLLTIQTTLWNWVHMPVSNDQIGFHLMQQFST